MDEYIYMISDYNDRDELDVMKMLDKGIVYADSLHEAEDKAREIRKEKFPDLDGSFIKAYKTEA